MSKFNTVRNDGMVLILTEEQLDTVVEGMKFYADNGCAAVRDQTMPVCERLNALALHLKKSASVFRAIERSFDAILNQDQTEISSLERDASDDHPL